ncbi:hypothetical protein CC2G_001523 [Coprinopsis cinerea AmutBmut pab1-1]|nr:hypothetical protein CC2G_001523 [Coprinopsis cinerea AmutBmut pab1-1]
MARTECREAVLFGLWEAFAKHRQSRNWGIVEDRRSFLFVFWRDADKACSLSLALDNPPPRTGLALTRTLHSSVQLQDG